MRISSRIRRWLTGPKSDPSVRARFLVDVEGRSSRDAQVRAAVRAIGRVGWAAALLEYQWPDGHWVTPGTTDGELYRPKYVVTNWTAIVLADLGMTRSDPRIRRTAELIMSRWGAKNGDLSGGSGEICVTGNAVRTLVRFGFLNHPVVQRSIDWIVRAQKADGGWHCFPSRTGTLDGWEGLAAFAEIPEDERDEAVRRAIARGAEFYLRHHLMDEGRVRYRPWFRIHYPNHYFYDILVGLHILTRLGYGADRRLARALRWLRGKQRPDGSWALDAAHPDFDARLAGYRYDEVMYPMMLEQLNEPSRWATVEALSVLAHADVS
jgi:prenyltransferase/squalene oxidase-like repeat protein